MKCRWCGNELGTGDDINICWECKNNRVDRGTLRYQEEIIKMIEENNKLLKKLKGGKDE